MALVNLAQIPEDIQRNYCYCLPICNADNQNLKTEIQRTEEEVEKTQIILSEHEEKITILLEQCRQIEQAFNQIKCLMHARNDECESEKHITMITKQESNRLYREIEKLEKQIKETAERRYHFENTLIEGDQRMRKLKAQMNFDNEVLEARYKENKRRDEDALLLQQYFLQDHSRCKELNLTLQKQEDQVLHLHKSIEKEAIEKSALEAEFDGSTKLFRKLHAERCQLVSHWEHTLDQMVTRDKHIHQIALKLGYAKREVLENKSLMKQKETFYKSEILNNELLEKRIEATVKQTGLLKMDLQEQEKHSQDLESELESLKLAVMGASRSLILARSENEQLKSTTRTKQSELDLVKEMCENLRQNLHVASDSALSAESKIKNADELLVLETGYWEGMMLNVKELREEVHRCEQKKQDEISEIKILTADKHKVAGMLRGTFTRIKSHDYTIDKQEDILIKQDFGIRTIQHRVYQMQGKVDDDTKKKALEAKVKQLKKELRMLCNSRKSLENFFNLQKLDVVRVKVAIQRLAPEKLSLSGQMENNDLTFIHCLREQKILAATKQELVLDLILLQLSYAHQRKMLNQKTSEVTDLEANRMNLEATVNERKAIILTQQAMIDASIRTIDQERQKIVFGLKLKVARMQQLKYRYEIVLDPIQLIGENDRGHMDDIIKRIALDKQKLLEEGDCLNNQVKKGKKELEALRNTVVLLNQINSSVRQSLRPVPSSAQVAKMKQLLDTQMIDLTVVLKQNLKKIAQMRSNYKATAFRAEELCQEKESLTTLIKEKQARYCEVKDAIDCCEEKLKRTDKMNKCLVCQIRTRYKTSHKLPEEYDIDLRLLYKLNKNAVNQMIEVIVTYPEIAADAEQMFHQVGILLPYHKHAPSSHSSMLSKTRSGSQIGIQPRKTRLSTTSSQLSGSRTGLQPSIRLSTASSLQSSSLKGKISQKPASSSSSSSTGLPSQKT